MKGNDNCKPEGKEYEETVKYQIGGIKFNVKREYSDGDGKKMSELLTGYIMKKEKL